MNISDKKQGDAPLLPTLLPDPKAVSQKMAALPKTDSVPSHVGRNSSVPRLPKNKSSTQNLLRSGTGASSTRASSNEPPICYDKDGSPRDLPLDSNRIAWLNQRPYFVHQFIGRGGFAEVYKAELLIPEGMEVLLDEHGEPEIDPETGCLSLVYAEGNNAGAITGGSLSAVAEASAENENSPRSSANSSGSEASLLPRGERVSPEQSKTSLAASHFLIGCEDGGDNSYMARNDSFATDVAPPGKGEWRGNAARDLLLPTPEENSMLSFAVQDVNVSRGTASVTSSKFFSSAKTNQSSKTSSGKVAHQFGLSQTILEESPSQETNSQDRTVLPSTWAPTTARPTDTSSLLRGALTDSVSPAPLTARTDSTLTSVSTAAFCTPFNSGKQNQTSEDGSAGEAEGFRADKEMRLKGTGLCYALKIAEAKTERHFDALVMEAEHLEKFRHLRSKRVVRMLDWETEWHQPDSGRRSRVLIIMELGICDLFSFLENNDYDLDAESLCRIWAGLVTSVAEVHSENVIHFDLKPHNFLLCIQDASAGKTCKGDFALDDGRHLILKLADFGLAAGIQDADTHLTHFGHYGTWTYMAPEALHQPGLEGAKHVDKKVDVWALGVMLYSMLHRGKTPWDKYKQQGNLELALAISNPMNRIGFHQMATWQRQQCLVKTVAESQDDVLLASGRSAEGSRSSVASENSSSRLSVSMFTEEDQSKPVSAAAEVQITISLVDAQAAATAYDAKKAEEYMNNSSRAPSSSPFSRAPLAKVYPPSRLLEIATAVKLEYLFRACIMCLRHDFHTRVSIDELLALTQAEREFFPCSETEHFTAVLDRLEGLSPASSRAPRAGDAVRAFHRIPRKSRKIANVIFPFDMDSGSKNDPCGSDEEKQSTSTSKPGLISSKSKSKFETIVEDPDGEDTIKKEKEQIKCLTWTVVISVLVLVIGLGIFLAVLLTNREKEPSVDEVCAGLEGRRYDPAPTDFADKGGMPLTCVEWVSSQNTDEGQGPHLAKKWHRWPLAFMEWTNEGKSWGERKYVPYGSEFFGTEWAENGKPMTKETFNHKIQPKRAKWLAHKAEEEQKGRTDYGERVGDVPDPYQIWESDMMKDAGFPPNPWPDAYPEWAQVIHRALPGGRKNLSGQINHPDEKDLDIHGDNGKNKKDECNKCGPSGGKTEPVNTEPGFLKGKLEEGS